MFSDLGAQPNYLLPVLFGLLGAAAGGISARWIQKWIRTRRLIKLGFSPDDLRSRERIFEKWGQITAAKVPLKISFNEIASHCWSDTPKYEQSKAELESLGFQRSGTFVASPQKWIAEFWLGNEAGLFAKIIDSRQRGVYVEVTVMDSDDSFLSFENTEDCGLQHRERDRWTHCGPISPSQLVEQAYQHRKGHGVKQMTLAECVNAYENAVNEHLAWRRKVGFSGIEMRRTFELSKKRRLLRGGTPVETSSHK
jgi:hypothetical protein